MFLLVCFDSLLYLASVMELFFPCVQNEIFPKITDVISSKQIKIFFENCFRSNDTTYSGVTPR